MPLFLFGGASSAEDRTESCRSFLPHVCPAHPPDAPTCDTTTTTHLYAPLACRALAPSARRELNI